jgi:transposase-like protein
MVKAKRAKLGPSPHDDAYKIAAVSRMLQQQRETMERGESTRGILQAAAKEAGISAPSFKGWMAKFRKEAGALNKGSSTRTLVSPPSSPRSAAVSVSNGLLPPLPTVTLAGLEEYVRALVAQEVKAAIRKAFGGE